MAILTIARELGAWTTAASQMLSSRFQGALFDRDNIQECLRAEGVDDDVIARYDERKPGFFSALSSDQEVFMLHLKTALLKAAAAQPIIILGRGGHVLMEDIPNCLRLRLIAPERTRLEHVMAEFKCDEESARRLMRKSDADRAGFCRFHFNSDWASPGCYDIVLNTEKLSDQDLVEHILWLSAHYFTPEQEAKAQEAIAHRLLGQRVVTHLLVNKKLPLVFIEADVEGDGVVTLRGAASVHDIAKKAVLAAKEVEGVKEVRNRIRVAVELAHTRI